MYKPCAVIHWVLKICLKGLAVLKWNGVGCRIWAALMPLYATSIPQLLVSALRKSCSLRYFIY